VENKGALFDLTPPQNLTALLFVQKRKLRTSGIIDPSQILTDVIMSGYLEKKGSGMLSGWKRRYFELGAQFLAYFENDEKKELLAAVDLSQVCDLIAPTHEFTSCACVGGIRVEQKPNEARLSSSVSGQ
jgi:hypothetical protein